MKLRLISTAFAVSLLPVAANAQLTIDMNAIKCDQYLAMSPANFRDFSAWMSGWFNQKANDSSLNIEGYRKNVANVQSWCASNPKANLMAGLEAAVAKAKAGTPGPTDIDAAQITCGQFLKGDLDKQGLVASWMGGWFMSTKNLTNVDPRYIRRNSKKIGAYCKKNKKAGLMAAIQKNWK